VSKLENYEATLADYRERSAALEAEIIACDVQKADARTRAIRLDATKRSDVGGANSEVGRIAKKKREKEGELKSLLEEIAAMQAVVGEHRQTEAEDALRAEIKKARGFRLRELDDWKLIIELFVALAHARTTWAEHMTAADEHAVRVDHSGLLAAAPHLKEEWLTAARPVVQPVPIDAMSMLVKLVEASADPHGEGTREEGGIRTAGRVLPTLIRELPDLNKRVALQGTNHLSGLFERTSYDRVKPNENSFEASRSAAGDAAAVLVGELSN